MEMVKRLFDRNSENSRCNISSEILNNYFVTPKPWSKVDRSTCRDCDKNIATFQLRPLSCDHMYKCLTRLNANAAPGLDSFTCQQLKLGKLNLIPKLCILFNRIIATGIVPSSWKKGKIITIYKGAGDKTDPSSYRPITLLSCLSKFFELCI